MPAKTTPPMSRYKVVRGHIFAPATLADAARQEIRTTATASETRAATGPIRGLKAATTRVRSPTDTTTTRSWPPSSASLYWRKTWPCALTVERSQPIALRTIAIMTTLTTVAVTTGGNQALVPDTPFS